MSLLPNLGTWLLRSVRGEHLTESPVSVVERLNSLRPLRDVDKDTLVGAVLMLAPSLQLALQMLMELLPPDESRERLGEVLCPTLWLLQGCLTNTIESFGAGKQEPAPPQTVHQPRQDVAPARVQHSKAGHPAQRKEKSRASSTPVSFDANERVGSMEHTLPLDAEQSARNASEDASVFAGFEKLRRTDSAADLALMKDLRAEMRVNAAIQVAVDSLEFAEGQLKIVKEVNRLKGGSFDLLQRHFYDGYNRILFRALELERREFDSPPYAASLAEEAIEEDETDPELQPSVSFESPLLLPSLPPLPPLPPMSPSRRSSGQHSTPPRAERRTPARRNTMQGIAEHDSKSVADRRLKLKRRLSLAEELALAGDDDTEVSDVEESGEEDVGQAGHFSHLQSSESESGSESSDEENSDDSADESAVTSRSQQPMPSNNEDSSADDEEESESASESDEDDREFSASSNTSANLTDGSRSGIAGAREGDAARMRKQLEPKAGVISPPTSPERRVSVSASDSIRSVTK